MAINTLDCSATMLLNLAKFICFSRRLSLILYRGTLLRIWTGRKFTTKVPELIQCLTVVASNSSRLLVVV